MRKIKALTKMEGVGFCRILRVFYMPTETTSLSFQLYNVHRNFDHFPQTGKIELKFKIPKFLLKKTLGNKGGEKADDDR